MTKKDFELIAATIIAVRPRAAFEGSEQQSLTLDTLSELFADKLAATNERFDRARFLKACGQ
jgi:hypothetical protein